MSYTPERPLKILTHAPWVYRGDWQGQTPVDLQFADLTQLPGSLPGIDVFIGNTFNMEMKEAADSLKLILLPGAGYEKIEFDALPDGCIVANAHEHEKAIAEWVIMAMIALDRKVIEAHRTLSNGSWEMSPLAGGPLLSELEGRTLGILGLGRIGKKAAQLARAFDMRIVAATRTLPSGDELSKLGLDYVVPIYEVDKVLTDSDFLLLSLPLSDETDGIINESTLSRMKPTAFLINVSRAGLANEAALYNALRNGQIAGAALDVWYSEPKGPDDYPQAANLPFWELDNVIVSPHTSGATTGLAQRRLTLFGSQVDRLVRGEPLLNVIHHG